MDTTCSSANQQQMDKVVTVLGKIFDEVLQSGFHGSAAVKIEITDGTIQHIRRKVERIEC
ncbi:hypothetical protein LCGC14_1042890 [marine sediment metagenome]|uniref:Uncharacterized protein n=1 Tax=marine sediment metagenome TaxID=412755 RepID=A0A0F9Q9H7_9ZZZZ